MAATDDVSAEVGGGPRPGCRLAFDGFSRSGAATFDSLVAAFEAGDWRPASGIRLDAIGASLTGEYRDGTTCILELLSNITDDEQGAYETTDAVQIRISCTPTEPGDTLQVGQVPPPFDPSRHHAGD